MRRRITAAVLALAMLILTLPTAVFAAEDYATRGEVCDMLLTAADDYNAGVEKTDILQGYEDGQLHEDWGVTRAEALVMLRRAFGEIPEIKGSNKYIAFPAETFTDIPEWAKTELSDVFDAGIVAGKSEGIFAPDDNVTKDEMELFIQRMYRVFGTNLKDDYYQTSNHDALNSAVISEGKVATGTMFGDQVSEQLKVVVKEAASSNPDKNSKAGKIKTLYDNYMNKDARNEQGYEPLKPYLDEIDSAESVSDLADTGAMDTFASFQIMIDQKDSTKYIDIFVTPSINTKDMYEGKDENAKEAYLEYVTKLFSLIGYSEADAKAAADTVFDLETQIAEVSLSLPDTYDVDKIYNIYSLDEICAEFKNVDIEKVFENSGLKLKDRFMVPDEGAMKKTAELLDDKNIDALKIYAKFALLSNYAQYLSEDFENVEDEYNSAVMGIQGTLDDETKAVSCIDSLVPDYLGELYGDKYVDEKTKTDLTEMIKGMIEIYRERLENNDWMGEATKQKALKKLDTMGIKVGCPDEYAEVALDSKDIRSYAEGGSLVENVMTIGEANEEDMIAKEGTEVDHGQWVATPQTVNAFYEPSFNDVTVCAGFLQMPGVYGTDASYEKNLGGIGMVVGHEISHAFDKSGSQYDENGNAVNWWTDEDAAAFDELCQGVIDFYDGCEAAPGIAMNGELTLTENTADMGGLSVVVELASKTENFDFKEMFESYANLQLCAAYREYLQFIATSDVHSLPSVRVNRLFQTCDKFFEIYGITEDDGMWVAPEDRVSIW